MENFFNPAGDLDNSLKNEKKVEESKNMDKYFTQGGDLTGSINNEYPIERENITGNFFNPAGDLTDSPKEEKTTTITNMDPIQNYINSIVSGTKFPDECDLGTLCSEGELIVSLAELDVMSTDESYNIISAEYFNSEMVVIHYQKYTKDNIKHL